METGCREHQSNRLPEFQPRSFDVLLKRSWGALQLSKAANWNVANTLWLVMSIPDIQGESSSSSIQASLTCCTCFPA